MLTITYALFPQEHKVFLLSSVDADSVQQGPYVVDAMNKFTQTTEVLWRKRDSAATLSEGKHLDPCLDRLLLAF